MADQIPRSARGMPRHNRADNARSRPAFQLSNLVQNAIIGSDNSLLGGIIGATALVAVNAALNRWLSLRPVDVAQTIGVQDGDGVTEAATGVMGPNGQLVLTLKKEERSASNGDIAGLRAQLKAMQARLELLAASR